jgi:hypothetical protein
MWNNFIAKPIIPIIPKSSKAIYFFLNRHKSKQLNNKIIVHRAHSTEHNIITSNEKTGRYSNIPK